MPISVYFFVLGILLLGLGLRRLKGPVSVSYLASSPYLAAGAYAPLPFSLAFLIWSFTFSPLAPETWKLWLFLTGGAVGVLGLFVSGKFLKPSWLRWLESEHGEIEWRLRLKVQRMGYKRWDQRINTQEELEEWVEEVRRKHGLEQKKHRS